MAGDSRAKEVQQELIALLDQIEDLLGDVRDVVVDNNKPRERKEQ